MVNYSRLSLFLIRTCVNMAANNFPSVTDMNSRQLHRATDTTPNVIQWCRQHGLLSTQMFCPRCVGRAMTESRDNKRKDGLRWRCHRCSKELSIREGSFFSNSKLGLDQIVDFMYAYAYQTATYRNLEREVGIDSEAICNWRSFARDIYAEHFIRHPLRIGGPGHTVEIDESAFVRRKHNVGRVVDTQWVFGGLDSVTQEGFLVAVPRRDAHTLLPILQDYVLPGTTVVSDLWRAYGTVGQMGYVHLTVNHSLNFVDPVTHATTNHVESMWARAKQRNKRECGTHRTLLPSYLMEFMWRQKYGKDPFEKFLQHLREVYPV